MTLRPERSVLVVDDDESIRESLRRLLSSDGYQITTAESGEEGLVALREKPGIQLVISDHNMPGMSGIEFLKLVRSRHPGVMRVMLTADPDPETVVRSINEGEVYRFIRKPWDNASLREMVYFAFDTILLEEEKRRLLEVVRRQRDALRQLDLSADPEAEMLLAEADLLKD